MSNQFKNPVFWCLVAIVLGTATLVKGYDKNESTITAKTKGAVPMMIVGGALLVGGLLGWQVIGKRK